MEEIIDTLYVRLKQRGLFPVEIVRLLKDVSNIIGEGGYFTVNGVNRKLMRLGWMDTIIDDYLFELIVYYLENEGTYRVRKYTVQ